MIALPNAGTDAINAVKQAAELGLKTPAQSRDRWDLYNLVATIPGNEAFRPMQDGGCALVTK